jgi:3-oxoacyl-[acyl-carrier-protein] synthase-3
MKKKKEIKSGSSIKSKFVSFGAYTPKGQLDNNKLATVMEIDPEWVEENVGINNRAVLSQGEDIVSMGTLAAIDALNSALEYIQIQDESWDMAKLKSKIRSLICGTNSPTEIWPSTAVKIQEQLVLEKCYSFDVQAGCAGWLYGVNIANNLINTLENDEFILVIGSDALSTQMFYHDRMGVLFGDGAGAALIGKGDNKSFILDVQLGSFYSNSLELKTGYEYQYNNVDLYTDGKSPNFEKPRPTMDGKAVVKLTHKSLRDNFNQIFKKNSLEPSQIKYFVPHQTNIHVVKSLCEFLNFPFKKVPFTLSYLGSISTAGIPTHFKKLLSDHDVARGDLILICSYGAGFAYGSSLFYY